MKKRITPLVTLLPRNQLQSNYKKNRMAKMSIHETNILPSLAITQKKPYLVLIGILLSILATFSVLLFTYEANAMTPNTSAEIASQLSPSVTCYAGGYRLPWEDGTTATVGRSYETGHGPGKIDFTIANKNVVAAKTGTLIYANDSHNLNDTDWWYWNTVVIKHADGEYSTYAHLAYNSIPGWIKDQCTTNYAAQNCNIPITAGTIIGVTGQTGYAPTIHLHFQTGSIVVYDNNHRDTQDEDGDGNYSEIIPTGYAWGPDDILHNVTFNNYDCDTVAYWSKSTPALTASSLDPFPPTITFTVTPPLNQWFISDQTIAWQITDNLGGSGVRGYKYSWDQNPPTGGEHIGSIGSVNLSSAEQGQHTLYVQAWDNNGNPSPVASLGWLGYDTMPPLNPAFAFPQCNAANNLWQNACNDTSFTWSGAIDSGSGIKDYHVYWGPLANGAPNQWTTIAAYDPSAIVDGETYYLRISTRDNMYHESAPATLYVLRYDTTPPATILTINEDAPTTFQINVTANIDSSDTASGVDQMRLSNNGQYWSVWQPYQISTGWNVPALDGYDVSVYAEVKDRAGNVGQAVDMIYLELNQNLPVSDNYRLCSRSVNLAGGLSQTSNYQLFSTVGDTGLGNLQNSTYNHNAGFLSDIENCWLPLFSTEQYAVTQSVIAAGGCLRSSLSYRTGDTLGQPLASSVFISNSYQLVGGFWSGISDTLPIPPPIYTSWTLASPTSEPAPILNLESEPGSFGININGGADYTNQLSVNITASAPDVIQIQLNNSPTLDENWFDYQTNVSWSLSGPENIGDPLTVYAWFREEQGDTFGVYSDQIYYDPIAPEGYFWNVGYDDIVLGNVVLWLDAFDNLSGVDSMRVSEYPSMEGANWVPYVHLLSWTLTDPSTLLYAQFRDRAGNISPIYDSNGNVYGNLLAPRIYLPLIYR